MGKGGELCKITGSGKYKRGRQGGREAVLAAIQEVEEEEERRNKKKKKRKRNERFR